MLLKIKVIEYGVKENEELLLDKIHSGQVRNRLNVTRDQLSRYGKFVRYRRRKWQTGFGV